MTDKKSQENHLLVIEDLQGRRTIILQEYRCSIGRHSSNDIIIYSKQISRRHATLIKKKQPHTGEYAYFIIDGDGVKNKSHNGIFINGKKCFFHELQDGDLINFGGDVNASYHVIAPELRSREPLVTLGGAVVTEVNGQLAVNRQTQATLRLLDTDEESSDGEETFLKPVHQDWLTGLSNRTLFNEHLSIALANAQEKEQQLALIYLDLDRFEEINNKYGYGIGDRALKEFANCVNDCLRGGDIVARWGGDEFAILIRQIKTNEDPVRVSERILNKLKKPFEIDDRQVYLRCNIGTAIYPQNGEDSATLIKNAALDLDRNKQQNANKQRVIATPPVDPKLARIDAILRRAIEREEFSLDYQPQVNINTGEIYGVEALLRWHHPKLGTMYPHQYLHWAEKTAAIVPISHWVLEAACRQNQAWQRSGLPRLPISINLSPQQFQQVDLPQAIAKVLEQTGLEPNWLELEIVEAALIHNKTVASQVFRQLTQLGIPVAIDDFGTANSSIGFLQEFSVNKLKIAQSCIGMLKNDPQKTGMISAAIALGNSFNLRVVAEGVETQEQLDLLRQLHCQEIQGYRFSKPLTSKEATQLLAQHWIVGR